MALRDQITQTTHDIAVDALADLYHEHGMFVFTNPNGEKNTAWCGEYIDVIVKDTEDSSEAWVIEVETPDSITESEMHNQWKAYEQAYFDQWFMAVPVDYVPLANDLLHRHHIKNCTLISWKLNKDGSHTFWWLPGIS